MTLDELIMKAGGIVDEKIDVGALTVYFDNGEDVHDIVLVVRRGSTCPQIPAIMIY
jgi:hypothetical protein